MPMLESFGLRGLNSSGAMLPPAMQSRDPSNHAGVLRMYKHQSDRIDRETFGTAALPTRLVLARSHVL